MILIADSGSTKTHWCVLENGSLAKEIFTKGINPFYQTETEIENELFQFLMPEIKHLPIKKVFFYGAGCAFPDKKLMISNALGAHLKDTIIEVDSDLLAAARALFQQNSGIACIMGTGSNSCFYDGKEIKNNISPLGFILGDEGSGAVLGKLLIADCLKNQLPIHLKDKLMNQYELTPALVLENVYKKPFPNRFLAKLTPFLLQNIQEPAIYNIVRNSFDAFFVRNVMQYPLDNVKVGFVGSVAHYFQETLKAVAFERNIEISEIVQSPMGGLIKYHA